MCGIYPLVKGRACLFAISKIILILEVWNCDAAEKEGLLSEEGNYVHVCL